MDGVVCLSGGKDSLASLIVGKECGYPISRAMWCEVMFDDETSGELPEHRDFMYNTVKPFVENEIGIPFDIVHGKKNYVDCFTHRIVRGAREGMMCGFPCGGMCCINRDCKSRPMQRYLKSLGGSWREYVGIAWDEPERLARLNPKKQFSVLAREKITEKEAFNIYADRGLISPSYDFSSRNGCWFCPNVKDREWSHIIFNHGHLFDKLIDLEIYSDQVVQKKLTREETPSQLRERILYMGYQTSAFIEGG